MSALITHIETLLHPYTGSDSPREVAMYIAEEMTGLTRTNLLCGRGEIEEAALQTVIQRVHAGEPLQYIFGRCLWRGMTLYVSPAVLIPRPETAELVDWICEAKNTQHAVPLRVLDACTGSGCIAIALKKEHPVWQIEALDISEAALQIAQRNAQTQQADVHFFQADVLEDKGHYGAYPYDVLVANPPYVRELEKQDMERNVLAYEPSQALFVSNSDPLIFYRRLAEQHLAPVLYFEINQYLWAETVALLQTMDYHTEMRRDIYGNPRMLRCQDLSHTPFAIF